MITMDIRRDTPLSPPIYRHAVYEEKRWYEFRVYQHPLEPELLCHSVQGGAPSSRYSVPSVVTLASMDPETNEETCAALVNFLQREKYSGERIAGEVYSLGLAFGEWRWRVLLEDGSS